MDLILILILIIIPVSISTIIYVNKKKYKNNELKKETTGFEIARTILDNNDLINIYITETNNSIISHYDSERKVIRLKNDIFNKKNIISCAIASRESAHAIQDKRNDKLFIFRKKISSFLDILLYIGYAIIAFGTLFAHLQTIYVGFGLVYFVFLFHLLTIKIEKEANAIAISEIKKSKLLTNKEINQLKKVLEVLVYINLASIVYPLVELSKRIIQFGESNK